MALVLIYCAVIPCSLTMRPKYSTSRLKSQCIDSFCDKCVSCNVSKNLFKVRVMVMMPRIANEKQCHPDIQNQHNQASLKTLDLGSSEKRRTSARKKGLLIHIFF